LAGGLNLYGYAGGDPINFSDPFGLTPACLAMPQFCLAGIVTAGKILARIAVAAAGAYAAHELANEAATAGAPERSIDDPGSLTGASAGEVEGAIPDGWVKGDSREGGGTRWLNPDRPGEAVRIQPGNPRDPNPVKRGPCVRVSKDGVKSDPIPLRGNPTLPKP